MKYNQQLNYRRRKRFLRRLMITVLIFIVLILAVIGYFYYDNFRTGNYNTPEQTTSAPTTSNIAPSIQVFRSPYFQFQTDKYWSEDPAASKDGKYVYRSLRSNLLEQQLTVYINSSPPNLAVTHVLVAELNGNRGFKTVKLSDHCGKAQKNNSSSFKTTLDQVTFTCFGDDTRYTALVGLAGGTPTISLPRPDGSTAAYTIYYSNVTADPDPKQLTEIVNSFQSR